MARVRNFALVVSALVLSCGDPDEEETSCNPVDRSGTYLVSATKLQGDCAELEPFTTMLVGETGEVAVLAPGQQCTVEMAELSASGCHLEFRFVCTSPTGIVGSYTGFNDANEDGSEIVGELAVQGDFGDGTGCASKYSFEMIRQ